VSPIEGVAQVRQVDLRGDLARPRGAPWMVKAVDQLEQQCGVLGFQTFDAQATIFFQLADALPGNETLGPGSVVRARPQKCPAPGINGRVHIF